MNYILLLILLVSFILRFWDLGGMPPHLRNDEAALGYNGYSILKTARDEHGEFIPLFFQSFGDWKMGLYVYLIVPFIAVFGLNELAVRLPSAIAGVISVWLLYEIVLCMFASKRLALIASLVFGISPIFIVFSRGAWEVNLSLTLTMAAIFFFLKAVSGRSKLFLFSSLFFGLTLLASHTAKLSTPVILVILFIAYLKQVKRISLKIIYLSVIIFLFFTIPLALSFTQGKVARLQTLSIFSYNLSTQDTYSSIASRWFSLYSFSTLFLKGDSNPQHTPPNTGLLLLLDSLFLILGAITLIRRGSKQQNIFIWSSLFLLSLPSVLTIEKINLERVLPMFIPLVILTSIGINSLGNFKKNIMIIFIFFYALNFIYFLDQYFVHAQKKNDAWQYGYKQIVEQVTPLKNQYQKIIVQQSLEHPYIFFLFYQKYDPVKYQAISKKVFMPNKTGKDMGFVSRIDNIEFQDIDWSNKKPMKDNLYVMPLYKLEQQQKFFKDYKQVMEIKDLNGFSLFKIVKI